MTDRPSAPRLRIVPFGDEQPLRDPPLQRGGGGGTSDGMDPWQQSVEDRLGKVGDKLDKQLLWLLAAMASGFLVLGGLIINRTDALGDKIGGLNERVVRIEAQSSASTIPPCRSGAASCQPWERAWPVQGPAVGTVVPGK